MSRKRKNPNCSPKNNLQFMQAADYEEQLIMYYQNMIIQMAMTRFKWINLPPTCNERYLEWILCTQGMATIASPKNAMGSFYSTQVVQTGRMNIYNNPTSWRSFGNNGWGFDCDHSNAVLVYDNVTRFPIMLGIEQYAKELAQIRMTKRINRLHQQIPFVLTGPQSKKQDMVNIFKNIASGEPAIIATQGFEDINIAKIDTDVTYLGEELAQDEANVWNRIYTMLGLDNSLYKKERQTEDEIQAYESPSNAVALSSLNERRYAANLLNERFGEYFDGEIQVVRARDFESDNYNFMHNSQKLLELEAKNGY